MNTLLILLIGGSAIVAVVLALRPFLKSLGSMDATAKAAEQLRQTGVPSRGRIANVQHGGMAFQAGIQRSMELVIALEVFPPQGGPAYMTTLRTVVGELQLPLVQPGSQCQVRVDPQAPQRVVIEAIYAPNGALVPLPTGAIPGIGSAGAMQKKIVLIAIPAVLAAVFGVGVALWASSPRIASLTGGTEAKVTCENARRCCEATEAASGNFMSDPAFDACFKSKLGAKVSEGTAPQRQMALNMCQAAIVALHGRCGK